MCTVVILRRPGDAWPLIIGANRDEMLNRPWWPPARHWPDRPDVVAGLDELGGGTWQGLNDHGVTAAVLNRVGSLGPDPNKRSRGELVLEALDHADASSAAAALAALDGNAYRSFNLVVADYTSAFWLRHDGGSRLFLDEVPAGLSMITAHDLNDLSSPRIRAYLPRFRGASPPDPGAGEWQAWEALLASQAPAGNGGPQAGMAIKAESMASFGTVSSALIALPAGDGAPVWRFAPGMPGEVPFEDVKLD